MSFTLRAPTPRRFPTKATTSGSPQFSNQSSRRDVLQKRQTHILECLDFVCVYELAGGKFCGAHASGTTFRRMIVVERDLEAGVTTVGFFLGRGSGTSGGGDERGGALNRLFFVEAVDGTGGTTSQLVGQSVSFLYADIGDVRRL